MALSQTCRTPAATWGSVIVSVNSVATAPGEITVVRML
jgi:hypothetical protein